MFKIPECVLQHPRLIHLCVVCIFLSLTLACASVRAPTEPTDDTFLRVGTYNVNYGMSSDQETVDAVVSTQAGVLCLQETTPQWEVSINAHPEIEKRYPHRIFLHSRGAGGLAVLSKYPIQETKTVHEGVGGWFPAWNVVVETPLGDVQFLNVHLRPPISDDGSWVAGYFMAEDVHMREMSAFRTMLDPKIPAVILGDFNEEPGGDTLETMEREGYTNALEEFDSSPTTWRWDLSIGSIKGALDHIFYEARLKALNAQVLPIGNSDHSPVITTLVRSDQLSGTK